MGDELLPVSCECASGCGELVLVTAAEYADAHREADWVLTVPGHPVDEGERGSRVVRTGSRFAVVAEGWAPDPGERGPGRERLAELRATASFFATCECDDCLAIPAAEAADVAVTLDEWDAIDQRTQTLIAADHPTAGRHEVRRTDRFVVVER